MIYRMFSEKLSYLSPQQLCEVAKRDSFKAREVEGHTARVGMALLYHIHLSLVLTEATGSMASRAESLGPIADFRTLGLRNLLLPPLY